MGKAPIGSTGRQAKRVGCFTFFVCLFNLIGYPAGPATVQVENNYCIKPILQDHDKYSIFIGETIKLSVHAKTPINNLSVTCSNNNISMIVDNTTAKGIIKPQK